MLLMKLKMSWIRFRPIDQQHYVGYACMCACMYVIMCICVCMYMYVCVYMYVHVCIFAHACMCAYVSLAIYNLHRPMCDIVCMYFVLLVVIDLFMYRKTFRSGV